jgi:hypothetical protein
LKRALGMATLDFRSERAVGTWRRKRGGRRGLLGNDEEYLSELQNIAAAVALLMTGDQGQDGVTPYLALEVNSVFPRKSQERLA